MLKWFAIELLYLLFRGSYNGYLRGSKLKLTEMIFTTFMRAIILLSKFKRTRNQTIKLGEVLRNIRQVKQWTDCSMSNWREKSPITNHHQCKKFLGNIWALLRSCLTENTASIKSLHWNIQFWLERKGTFTAKFRLNIIEYKPPKKALTYVVFSDVCSQEAIFDSS